MDYLKNLVALPSNLAAAKRRPNLPPKKYVAYNPFYEAMGPQTQNQRESYKREQYEQLSSAKREYARSENISSENNLIDIKMSNNINSVPRSVLSNGNVLLANGNIVEGDVIRDATNAANANATPVSVLPNGNVLMNNGNVVNPNFSQTQNSTPVNVSNGNVVMSNGNIVANKNVANLPNAPPNAANTSSLNNKANMATQQANMIAQANMAAQANANMFKQQQANMMAQANANVLRQANMANSLMMMPNTTMNGMMQQTQDCPIAPPSQAMRYCRPAPFHSSSGEAYFYVGEAYGSPVAE